MYAGVLQQRLRWLSETEQITIFINYLKNMIKAKNELELVHDFVVHTKLRILQSRKLFKGIASYLRDYRSAEVENRKPKQLCTIAKNVSQGNILRRYDSGAKRVIMYVIAKTRER